MNTTNFFNLITLFLPCLFERIQLQHINYIKLHINKLQVIIKFVAEPNK